jgi:hypothetical protein
VLGDLGLDDAAVAELMEAGVARESGASERSTD